jgi:hypothetical protein
LTPNSYLFLPCIKKSSTTLPDCPGATPLADALEKAGFDEALDVKSSGDKSGKGDGN